MRSAHRHQGDLRRSASKPDHRRVIHRRCLQTLVLAMGVLLLCGCSAAAPSTPATPADAFEAAASASATQEATRMWMTIGTRRFAITLADTDAARALAARLPLTLAMSDLNGNEKKVDLPDSLPTSAVRPGTIRLGDVMLYGSDTVVIFYKAFRSSYSYTPLGRVEDTGELTRALGSGDVSVVLSTP